ncbi:hypothetical protein CCMSSC00406_0007067 [Pleurotus cornucopiae]|uniref:Uncharacterized protein n=1 Tax=Pleurotus cornucopiae TaxID=5321 RepID=A0ACB7J559_PLECO|nr:hypothetical protein CCMSSC00406_0007067 [Pleurotus cornucopiae]
MWFAGPLHIPRENLQNLRILEVSLHSASSIILGQHITHLKINSNAYNMNNATHWSNLLNMDPEALRNVVVFAADFIKFDVLVKLVARMPNLELLQSAVSPASRVQWLSKLAALPAPKLRHLRFDAPWLPYGGDPSRYHDGVRSAFDAMPGLPCISVSTGLNPTFPHPPIEYDFFFRAIPAVRFRYRHRHPSPSPWWEDWEAD